ncbi:MAG: T9SS type A sorting domain-containing protein [Bacteroidia bacterium]|nr:T9SS type A sorting domain-containing protein [Bacteroidia bacterium]
MKKTLLLFLLGLITTVGANAQSCVTFSSKNFIDANVGDAPFAMGAGILDGDIYPDIVVASYLDGMIKVYLNTTGDLSSISGVAVTNTLGNDIGGIKLADLDGQNGLDIIALAYTNDILAWYPNNGSGGFPTENVISTSVLGASGLTAGDIDDDGDIDIVVTAYDGDEVIWFSNSGTTTPTFTEATPAIDTSLNAPGSVQLRDIDGDGDLDAIVSNAQFAGANDEVKIFRNELYVGMTGPFLPVTWTAINPSVATGLNYIFNAAMPDLDGDAFLDVFVSELNTSPGAGSFHWYEDGNSDPFDGSVFTQTTFTTTIGNPAAAMAHDLDGDGDKDIILSSGQALSSTQLVYFEQLGTPSPNPSGTFGAECIIDATQSQTYVFAVQDFDQDVDADLDIATIAYNQDALTWFENDPPALGVDDFEVDQKGIYPNPAQNELNFRGFNETLDVEVFDLLGKSVISTRVQPNEGLGVSSLQNGVYILRVNDSTVFKFVKE